MRTFSVTADFLIGFKTANNAIVAAHNVTFPMTMVICEY